MILDDLVAVTKIRLARHQRQQSLADLKQTVAKMPRNHKPDFLTRSPKRTIKLVPMLSRF